MPLRIAERLFPWLAALIALTIGWMGIGEVFETGDRPHRVPTVMFSLGIFLLFGVTAASVWWRLRIRRLAALSCSACTALYAISMLREGWDFPFLGPILLTFVATVTVLGLIVGIVEPERAIRGAQGTS